MPWENEPLTRRSAAPSPRCAGRGNSGREPSPRLRGEGGPERSEGPDEGVDSEIIVKRWVCIILGSDSDAAVMAQACSTLDDAGVPYEMKVASAHRSPERTRQVVTDAERDGAAVFIAGAGMAAHLPGMVASFTTRPVIGVPLSGSTLQGLDALLAVVQMPPGIPVATVAIDGARNAAILAAQMLAIEDSALAGRLKEQRSTMAKAVVEKSKPIERSTR